MSKLNIVKVREIAFTKLRKHEVYTFYNDIMRVIGRYNTKAMHIEDTCDVLIGMRRKACEVCSHYSQSNENCGKSRFCR